MRSLVSVAAAVLVCGAVTAQEPSFQVGLAEIDITAPAGYRLLADFVRAQGASAVVKGLRSGADFDAELPMALMNRHLSGVDTVFVVGDPALAHVASSLVKDVARYGGPIDDLVPAGVGDAVRAALARTGGSAR